MLQHVSHLPSCFIRVFSEFSLPIVQEAMRDFRSGKASVLVATDVAGRGLHISRWIL